MAKDEVLTRVQTGRIATAENDRPQCAMEPKFEHWTIRSGSDLKKKWLRTWRSRHNVNE